MLGCCGNDAEVEGSRRVLEGGIAAIGPGTVVMAAGSPLSTVDLWINTDG